MLKWIYPNNWKLEQVTYYIHVVFYWKIHLFNVKIIGIYKAGKFDQINLDH